MNPLVILLPRAGLPNSGHETTEGRGLPQPRHGDGAGHRQQVSISLAISQALIWPPLMARLPTGTIRRVYPEDTYKAMLAEDFTPAGLRQTRTEFTAVAAAIHQFRAQPPARPGCPAILLSASRPLRRGSDQQAIADHQRRYVQTSPDGRFEQIDSSHFIHAEQPAIAADRIQHLLDRASTPATAWRLPDAAPTNS